ncbi:MAG: hypothetical protein MR400_01355 [Clostridiales bacterium]|nr:hypothetical protein [Clostridiales bacterium]
MSKEKSSAASPFAALTYQEQQERWLAWRSRQLDYKSAETPPAEPSVPPEPTRPPEPPVPPVRLPYFQQAAPTRHQELDRVLSRHAAAVRKTGPFTKADRSE